MDYRILENFLNSPLKIYDGCEPKHIYYNLKNEQGNTISKIDLWNFWEETSELITINDKSELNNINTKLNMTVKTDFMSEGDEVIVFDIYQKGNSVPVVFIKLKKHEDYIISFILNEKSPSRYQCFILAVIVVARQ